LYKIKFKKKKNIKGLVQFPNGLSVRRDDTKFVILEDNDEVVSFKNQVRVKVNE